MIKELLKPEKDILDTIYKICKIRGTYFHEFFMDSEINNPEDVRRVVDEFEKNFYKCPDNVKI